MKRLGLFIKLVSQRERDRFRIQLFRRYATKPKIILSWSDLNNLDEWIESDEFLKSGGEIPLIPFVNRGVFYFEHYYNEETGKNEYIDSEKVKNRFGYTPMSRDEKRKTRKLQPNMVEGLVFDKVGDDDWHFKIVTPNADKQIGHRHLVHFRTTNMQSGLTPEEVVEKGCMDAVQPDGVTPLVAREDMQGVFEVTDIEVIDAELSREPIYLVKQFAVNMFQKFMMCNYFLLNHTKQIVVSDYDGSAIINKMPNRTRKQKLKIVARKQAIDMGKVYRCRVSPDWVRQQREEYNYRQPSGEVPTGWRTRRVKDDYWERYPERLSGEPTETSSGFMQYYRPVAPDLLETLLSYLSPLAEDEIFIEVLVETFSWERDPKLLKGDCGYKANTYTFKNQ